jgi:hypothetical protein
LESAKGYGITEPDPATICRSTLLVQRENAALKRLSPPASSRVIER